MNTKAMNQTPKSSLPSRTESQFHQSKFFFIVVFYKNFRLFLLLARLLLLHHLLDNLLLLDQEGTDDSVTDAAAAPGTTVGALDGLLGLGDLGVLAGAESGNLCVNAGQLLIRCG